MRSSPTPRAQTRTTRYPARACADYLLWTIVTRRTVIVPDGQIAGTVTVRGHQENSESLATQQTQLSPGPLSSGLNFMHRRSSSEYPLLPRGVL